MIKSDYIHKIEEFAGRNVIVIEDLDLGGKSVTNNIENVVREIEVMEKVNASDYMIVYKDSEELFDAWDKRKEQFIPLRKSHWKGAVIKYIQLQLEQSIIRKPVINSLVNGYQI